MATLSPRTGGIAPQWLVDTQGQRYAQLLNEGAGEAAIERELTAGKSGLTEQAWSQAAAIQGSAGEAADFHEQQFGSLVVHAQDAQVQGDLPTCSATTCSGSMPMAMDRFQS